MTLTVGTVRLGGGADGVPLHLVPGLGGQALSFVALARGVAPACALHCFHLDRCSSPPVTEPDLVGRYIDALRASGPGPYRLAGYCAGAYVACAITSRLREDERAGAVLAIVRTGDEEGAWRAAEALPDVRASVRRLRRRHSEGAGRGFDAADRELLDTLGIPDGLAPEHALHVAEVMAAQLAAMDTMREPEFDVPVTVVIGAPDRASALGLQEHWRTISGRPAGAHLVVGPLSDGWLRRPGVELLARLVARELAA